MYATSTTAYDSGAPSLMQPAYQQTTYGTMPQAGMQPVMTPQGPPQPMPGQAGRIEEVEYGMKPQHKGRWKTAMLIAAFVISMLAFVGLIILAFIYGFGSHTNSKHPGWTIVDITNKNSTAYAAGNNIFSIDYSATGTSLTVSPPVDGMIKLYRSRVFIIDNTANKFDLQVKHSSNCTMVDTTANSGKVLAKSSAMYFWSADSDTFNRLM